MSLKTSFFNKSVIKSDFKRFWWLSALNTLAILIFFTLIFVYDQTISQRFLPSDQMSYEYNRSAFYNSGSIAMVLALMFSPALCVLIFSYLNSAKSVACLHGLPIKRSTFFWSHVLSGFVMAIIPIIINALVLLAFRLHPSIAQSCRISHLFIWASHYTVYAALAFAVTTAVMMITGNSVAGIIFTYIFAVLPVAEEAFVKFFFDQNLYGYNMNSENFITKFLYMFPEDLYFRPMNILKYIIFTAIFLIAAVLIYKKRNLENNGEIVAFPKLRYVFVYGVAVCAGAAGYAYLSALMNESSVWMLIPFGVIGIIIAEMIVKKSFKVKTVYKPIFIFCICIGIIQLCFTTDLFGFERRLPKAADIKEIEFKCDVSYTNTYYRGYRVDNKQIIFEDTDCIITDPDTIEKLVKLHDNLIQVRYDNDKTKQYMGVEFTYTLKNGRKISRAYTAEYDTHNLTLQPVIESMDVRKIYFPILKDNKKTFVSLNIQDKRIDHTGITYHSDNADEKEIMDRFIEALKADTAKTAYDKFVRRNPEYTRIEVYYKPHGVFDDGTDVPDEHLPHVNEQYYIRDDYTNTIALLNELGFYNKLPKAADIKEIGINHYGKRETTEVEVSSLYVSTADISTKEAIDCDKIITDTEQIREIFNYFGDKYRSFDSYNTTMFINLKNGHTITIEYDIDAEGIPEVLK